MVSFLVIVALPSLLMFGLHAVACGLLAASAVCLKPR